MSKLDSILSFVNQIELRSNKLSNITLESNDLINQISQINETITKFDQDIDDINNLINTNQSSINQVNNLYEKSFYLENNLIYNDNITNQTSFEKLTQEYLYILNNLKKNDEYTQVTHPLPEIEPQPEISESTPTPYVTTPTPSPPNLKQMISISNLRLKPMRCASSSDTKSIAKKKSKYRLSNIYNINPVAYEDSTVSSEDNEFEEEAMVNSVSNSYETLNSLHNEHDVLKKDQTFTPRPRSNSVPTTKSNMSLTDSDIFKDLDCENELLQFNRLKHFVSFNHLPHEDDDDIFFNDFMNSPTPHCDDDFDLESIVSDLSQYSPESEVDGIDFGFDNYSQFLRKSRTNLNQDIEQAFPHLLRPKEQEMTQSQFQNPVQMSASHVATPILDTIYYTPTSTNEKNSASNLLNSFVENNHTTTQSSFTNTLLSFVSTPASTPTNSTSTKPTTPQKIKDLKKLKRFKSNPISVPNEIQKKRIPSQITTITIPKANQFYRSTNSGMSGLLRNPILKSYNGDALKEALANSLLD